MPMLRIMAAALILVLPVAAQRARTPAKSVPASPLPPDPARSFPLAEIKVTGMKNFTPEQVIAMSGLKTGAEVSKADFDAAQQRLLETGLFETVAYRYEPAGQGKVYTATLEVKEIQQIYPYRFEAIPGDEKPLREWLRAKEPLFGDRIPPTEPVLKRFSTAIEEYFKKQGSQLEVIGRLLPNNKNELEVIFQPSSLPSVAEVKFTGNKSIDQATLQQAVAGTAIGSVFTEERFRQILENTIRPLYEAQGRLRVSFPKIETAPAQGVRGLVATVHVAEGEQYKLTNVRLTGPVADDPSLLKTGGFDLNAIVNMTAVNEGTDRIERSLKRRGYLSARSVIDRRIDDKAKTVALSIEVDPGPQYKMGQLTIEGLDIQTEPHIRKMWALKEKQPFDAEYPDLFIAKMPEVLDNLGKTRAAVNPDPGRLVVDVILIFSPPEKKPKQPKF